MGRFTVLMLVLIAMFIAVPSGPARAEVIVDEFDTGYQQFFGSPSPGTSSYVTASNALGGNRYALVTRTTGSSVSFVADAGGSDTLTIDNGANSKGIHQVSYGYNGSTTGNNNWDFSKESAFLLEVVFVDSGSNSGTTGKIGDLVVTVYDGSSGASSYSTSAINWPSTTGGWSIPFTAFSGSPTWSAIDRIDFVFAADNLSPDLSLDFIKAVPEPSTLLLLLGGGALCGVSAWRRRRRTA